MSAGTLAAIAATLAAYGRGSVSGALLVGRLRGGVDIRMLGSGNAGGTNALRTQGPWFALGVIVIDLGKGWLAAAWLPLAAARFGASALGLPEACAFAAMLGHVWPLWHGFRGGKGAATLVGARSEERIPAPGPVNRRPVRRRGRAARDPYPSRLHRPQARRHRAARTAPVAPGPGPLKCPRPRRIGSRRPSRSGSFAAWETGVSRRGRRSRGSSA